MSYHRRRGLGESVYLPPVNVDMSLPVSTGTKLAPGTPETPAADPVWGAVRSSDPKTVEQFATLQSLQTASGEIGSQYGGSLLLPNGTLTMDLSNLTIPPARQTEIQNALNAKGKPTMIPNPDGTTSQAISGGYILALNTDGVPISFIACSGTQVQTVAEKALAVIVKNAAAGYTAPEVIAAAQQGVQVDGTPIDAPYVAYVQKLATVNAIPFTPPSSAQVRAAQTQAAPAAPSMNLTVPATATPGVLNASVGGIPVWVLGAGALGAFFLLRRRGTA